MLKALYKVALCQFVQIITAEIHAVCVFAT